MKTVEVLVNGKPIKQYSQGSKVFVEARVNTEYTIKVRNPTHARQLAVITVDGINVISGDVSTSSKMGEGYVVNEESAVTIKGFRKDMDSVGAFKFCQSSQSYCNSKGIKGNNGVIGIKIYNEIPNIPIYRNVWEPWGISSQPDETPWIGMPTVTCSDNDSYKSSQTLGASQSYNAGSAGYSSNVVNCCASLSSPQKAPNFEVGTTWGKQIDNSVVTVDFKPYAHPTEKIEIYYDSKKNLKKIGIQFGKKQAVSYPDAFNPKFATPPQGWRG